MPRKPFFREFDGWWYAQINAGRKRKQIKLVKGRDKQAEAQRAFHRLMATEVGVVPEPSALLVASVCDLFLEHSQRHHEPSTYCWYRFFLQDFCSAYSRLPVGDLKPFHVNRWLDLHGGWKQGGRRHAITCVKRAISWAEGEGLVAVNPIRSLRKPPGRSRDRVLSNGEKEQVLAAIKDPQFRLFVEAMQETGACPSEVARVTAADVNLELGIWVLQKHKTSKKTGKPRLIYLTPRMVEITQQLAGTNPQGPL